MKRKRFYYTDQSFNYNDLIIFCAVIMMNVALMIVSFIFNQTDPSDYVVDITATTLLFIFNVPAIVHFTFKAVKMYLFRRKLMYFMANGKKFRAKIIDEQLGKPLYESEIFTVDTYHPKVKFYDSSVGKEVTLTSEFPICASFRDALSSDMVTIYVIDGIFIISDFSPAYTEEYSLSRRTLKGSETEELIEKMDRKVLIIYSVAAVIVLLLMLALKITAHWFFT